MSTIIKGPLLLIVGGVIVTLHILGYLQPGLIVGSRIVNRIAIPLLVGSVFFLPMVVKISVNAWKTEPIIKWGNVVFLVLASVEALLYVALMFNMLSAFGPKFVPVDSNPDFQMLESRLGHLILFSVLGGWLLPYVVIGLRESFEEYRR